MEANRTAELVDLRDWRAAKGLAAQARFEVGDDAALVVRVANKFRIKACRGAVETGPLAAHG